ncbi:hypothetical protein EVAR_94820_1 [Eumeta japonica]|uniref:Uncharacterized protein n=1 Tax=Eumeta variegata TaxID=151549 RepID=A0A4C1UH80_EUMVA|nr:hypothetical protein EVAR_94820_1 [Eumeta japonica]
MGRIKIDSGNQIERPVTPSNKSNPTASRVLAVAFIKLFSTAETAQKFRDGTSRRLVSYPTSYRRGGNLFEHNESSRVNHEIIVELISPPRCGWARAAVSEPLSRRPSPVDIV